MINSSQEEKKLLKKLNLVNINGYKLSYILGGESALSAVYIKKTNKVVFKFLVNPRNDYELEKFKLEAAVLNKNRINYYWPYNSPSDNTQPVNNTSYPIPKLVHNIKHKNNTYFFSYEYIEGESLSAVINKLEGSSLQEKLSLLYRVASGLNYLNQAGISHRDLHPDNIFILENHSMVEHLGNRNSFNDPRVIFIDLGSCSVTSPMEFAFFNTGHINKKIIETGDERKIISSFRSMPPDFLHKGKSVENYDSWSFGIFAYKLIFNENPIKAETINELYNLNEIDIYSHNFKSNLESLDTGLKQVLKHLLSINGKNRPDISSIVRLFLWINHIPQKINTSIEFANKVIHNDGFDPDHDPLDDIY